MTNDVIVIVKIYWIVSGVVSGFRLPPGWVPIKHVSFVDWKEANNPRYHC